MKDRVKRVLRQSEPFVRWIAASAASVLLILAAVSYELTGDYMGVFKFFRTISVIEEHYAGAVDKKALLNGAMKGMVNTLGDVHSSYLTSEEMKLFTEQMTASYAGIGVYIGETEDGALVAGVIDGSPAGEAGLKRGDVILSIDGTAAAEMKLEDVSAAIRGPAGTQVSLKLRRDGADEDIVLTRREIHMQTVAGEMMGQTDIGYIRIAMFSEGTGAEFAKEYEKLRRQGMKKMILDLRNNPGGLIDQAAAVAAKFVPENSVIVSYTGSDGKEEQYTAAGTGDLIPLVVLINENSASASEIIAGDVQDMNLGKIIGVRSYGKGTVQGVYPVAAGDAVKITVAKYRTTNGRFVDGTGIEPDIAVQLKPGDTEDYQLEKAMEVLDNL